MATPTPPAQPPANPSQTNLKDLFANANLQSPLQGKVKDLTDVELAQALVERLTLHDSNWHQKKSNRSVRAQEQVAAALVYLLQGQTNEALPRLESAVGWLNRSISAPPCPDHGDRRPN